MVRSSSGVFLSKWTPRLLFAVGLLILGYCGADWLNSGMQQAAGNQELDQILSEGPKAARTRISGGELVGKVEIPKLNLSAVVFQGTDDKVLRRGVGHLDGSALPGQAGNVVLAAHRDTFFRSLRNIDRGDVITVTTEAAHRTYKVDSIDIVSPTDTGVAAPTSRPTLTLITCYPFYFVGHAPKRFVVQALEVDGIDSAEAERPDKPDEKARIASLEEKTPGRIDSFQRTRPEETSGLTYIFRASR